MPRHVRLTLETTPVPTLPARVALYRRVSHPDQVIKDLSLPEQASQQRAWVTSIGGIITHDFEDAAISGKEMRNRPDFLAMIEAAKRLEFDLLLIHKSDRSFRNRFEAVTTKVMLKNLGIKLASVVEPWFGSDEPEDQLLEGLMECVAEWYSGNMSREIKKGIRSAANNQGRQQGQPAFGYTWASPGVPRAGWIVDDETAHWVRYIYQRTLEGAIAADICRELNALNIAPPASRFNPERPYVNGWLSQTVTVILTNHVYTGVVTAAGQEFKGHQATLIDKETFDRVQDILERRGKTRSETSDAFFVGGLLLCPLCHAANRHGILSHAPYWNKRGERIRRYSCSTGIYSRNQRSVGIVPANKCPGYTINESVIVKGLRKSLTQVGAVVAPAQIDADLVRRAGERRVSERTFTDRMTAIEKELAAIPMLRTRFQWQHGIGGMTDDEFLNNLSELSKRESELTAMLKGVESERAGRSGIGIDEAHAILYAIDAPDLTPIQRRDILRTFIRVMMPSADKTSLDVFYLASDEGFTR